MITNRELIAWLAVMVLIFVCMGLFIALNNNHVFHFEDCRFIRTEEKYWVFECLKVIKP